MKVISFSDRKALIIADSYACPVSVPNETGNPKLQIVEETYQPVMAGENRAVRHFALTIAEKLLKDRELNHAAPFLVDKIVKMLVNESRCVHDRD